MRRVSRIFNANLLIKNKVKLIEYFENNFSKTLKILYKSLGRISRFFMELKCILFIDKITYIYNVF